MRRKKSSGGGGASWMDTYGDMVTLLLCFFVLLYSMSSISEDNWKALVMSFNPDAMQTLTQTTGNDGPNADPNTDDGSGMGFNKEAEDTDMEKLYQSLTSYVQSMNLQGSIAVTRGEGKIFVTFNQSIFFDGEDWALREESKPILENVGAMLSQAQDSIDEVRVLGHTAQANADRPNDPTVDRLLSSQRAANALAYIQEHCTVDPARMISEGYGQWRPVATNDTEEGRAQNRRVEMIISGHQIEGELKESVTEYHTEESKEMEAQGESQGGAASSAAS